MVKARFDTKLFGRLESILFRLQNGESLDDVRVDFRIQFKDVPLVEILLLAHELKSIHETITSTNIERLFVLCHELFGHLVEDLYNEHIQDSGHPVQVFLKENKILLKMLKEVNELMETLAEGQATNQTSHIEKLQDKYLQLGRSFSHYDRKEKLFFPILERYGHFTLARIMWADDDQIRNLYKGTGSMIDRLPKLPFKYVKKSYNQLERRFKEMVFDEKAFLLPVISHYFTVEDWLAIAKESDAYGFALDDLDGTWTKGKEYNETIRERMNEDINFETTPIPFGGGYLTIKEADVILNNLPVEITFVDKFGVFKYFNDMVKSSEMMFIRTPSAIGRNVGHCHPPKSMQKVAKLISELKTKQRLSENMWFKKDGRFIHITYKGLFDKNDEYLGILEYVQDIQPFRDLPREVKKEISRLKDEQKS